MPALVHPHGTAAAAHAAWQREGRVAGACVELPTFGVIYAWDGAGGLVVFSARTISHGPHDGCPLVYTPPKWGIGAHLAMRPGDDGE
jgi:hypothetical protein